MSTPSPFIPTDSPFEIIGFIEEFEDVKTGKYLGYRRMESPIRACGSPGRIQMRLNASVKLKKGFKDNWVRASPTNPRPVWATITILCGKVKR